jgi:hypothetical protein
MTISWSRDRLRELGLETVLIPPGIDLDNSRPLNDQRRRDDIFLALGRADEPGIRYLTAPSECLVPAPEPTKVAAAWERRTDALESFLERVAGPRRIASSTGVVPEMQRSRRD